MVENLMIATQALGIGGHPVLRRQGPRDPRRRAPMARRSAARDHAARSASRFTACPTTPRWARGRRFPVGLEGIFEGACPPFHADMDAAVDFVLDQRWGERGIFSAPESRQIPWRSPEVARAVPRPSDEAIEATKTLCRYIWNTYGRFPATIDPFLMTVWYQAAHLDVDFYDRYYPPEALPAARALAHARLARAVGHRARGGRRDPRARRLSSSSSAACSRRRGSATGLTGRSRPHRDNAILFPHMYSGTPASLDPWIGARAPARSGALVHHLPRPARQAASRPRRAAPQGPFRSSRSGTTSPPSTGSCQSTSGSSGSSSSLGFSMGAQQAYEWAVRFPRRSADWRCSPGSRGRRLANDLLVAAAAEALASGGLAAHARFWAATGLSAGAVPPRGLARGRLRLGAPIWSPACSRRTTRACDAADLLVQLAKWRRADVARHTGGDLAAALGRDHRPHDRHRVLTRQLVPGGGLPGRAAS